MPLRSSFLLIILLGIVSLLGDITYEGARSIIGPYFFSLGASAAVVGFVSGLAEFLGYSLRLISGYLADKIKKYWSITILGYVINLFSVPSLALVKNWFQVGILVITERIGKAIRTPSRDTILSYATSKIGRGKGFGFHEAMDQIGAITGPLIVAWFLFYTKSYKLAFSILIIPAFLAILILLISMLLYPHPQKLEESTVLKRTKGFSKTFWLYAIAIGIYGAGYSDFALIAYHLEKLKILKPEIIPLLYALAMGVDAIAALVFGYLFDKKGFLILIFSILISIPFAPCVFLGNFHIVLLGMIFWGIGMGAQESIIRASVSLFLSKEKRATGYGAFNTIYGLFWFAGSFLMGLFYDISIYLLIIVSLSLQIISIPLLINVYKNSFKTM